MSPRHRHPAAPFAVRRLPQAARRVRISQRARRARRHLLVGLPLLAGLLVCFSLRRELFGVDVPVRIAAAVLLAAVGWQVASDLGRVLQPRLAGRLSPETAAAAGFVVRLVALAVVLLAALRLAGLAPGALLAGASFTAIVLGLAAQQTVGNVFAGVVLLSARPFRVGDRVRFSGFGMDVEGTVVSHGLLYVTCTDGADLVLVPNNTALTMSVRPIREPAAVDMRARLPARVDPEAVQQGVADAVQVDTRGALDVALEEFDGEDVVVRIRATPADRRQGGALAREVLHAVAGFSAAGRNGAGPPVPAR